MKKLLRLTTSSISLDKLIPGQLRFLSQYYDVVGAASDIGSLQCVGEREGVRVVDVKMAREISLVQDVKSLLNLIRLIRLEKPIIVHANTPKASLLGMIAAWLCRVPHRIYTVTGLRFEGESGRFRTLLVGMERLTCAFATKVIPEGEGVKKRLIQEKITRKPLSVILNGNINGIDTAHFSRSHYPEEVRKALRDELGIGENDFVFVFVGRMTSHKGVNELISAFAEVSRSEFRVSSFEDARITNPRDEEKRKEVDDTQSAKSLSLRGEVWRGASKLLLVGPLEQELDPLLPETLHEIESNKDVISVGYQDDVRPYLAISDALAFPSYREGFPNVVMQAGAMDLPSIVTDINGCNEIIIEGENGVIIPAKDAEALRTAMRQFLDNPDNTEKMASRSRKMIVERYEQQAVWEALLEEYRALLSIPLPLSPRGMGGVSN
ncbi:MAG TPA: glycosyltransferase family 4 protein [Petrimonas sp.]|nr:glycosyltransferase family 4 protein [Petrimonas sp.]